MSTPVPPLVPTASMPLATDSDAQFDAKAFPALASLNPFGVSLEAIAASAVSNADAALAAAIGGDLPPLTGEALKYLRVNAGETAAEFSAIPTQTTAVWEAGTDTNESLVSAAKVAAAIAAQVVVPNAAGSVGTYAFAWWETGGEGPLFGDTVAGSTLRPAGITGWDKNVDDTEILSGDVTFGSGGTGVTALSGTWRSMGEGKINAFGGGAYVHTLWLRIS